MAKRDFYEQYLSSAAPFGERCPIGEMETLLRRRNGREFMDRFIAIFSAAREQNLFIYSGDDQNYFGKLFELWFDLLARPSFQFAPGDEKLFSLLGNIANLLAVTQHKNGDECLKKVLNQSDNLVKVLLLYTPRSRLELSVKAFFDANPQWASLWYASVWNSVDTYAHPVVHQNCRYFMENYDERFEPFDSNVVCAYFRCTYVDNRMDLAFKRKLNGAIRRYCGGAAVRNRPNPRSVAVVSAYWDGRHAVYRAFAPYVAELAKSYDLTLVHLAGGGRRPDVSLFRRVCEVTASADRIQIANIVNNDFQLAYYPDVGMSQESMYLSNIRIAPIQIMGTGHPVSSGSPVMDYFVSGGEVEAGDGAEANYGERLALLPGLSVHPVRPDYKPQRPEPSRDEYLVNCPWMHMKINYPILAVLKRIAERAKRRVVFQFFPGNGMSRNNAYMATMQDIASVLGLENSRVHFDMAYPQYMHAQEFGRFTMHSYPFGGGTTAVDALVIGKPLVVLRGGHEYNRYAATLLRRLGLDELVADSEDRLVEISLRLIDDGAYLEDVTGRVRAADLDRGIFRVEDASCLGRAVDVLIGRDAELRRDADKKPVRIE